MIPQAVLDYREFYHSPAPADPFYFLKKYPTDIIILELARINALIFQEVNAKFILLKRIITETFPLLDENRKQLLSFVLNRSKEEGEPPVIFTSQSISKLIGLAFENYNSENPERQINTEAFQNDLWDNILVANEVYYNQVKANDDINTYPTLWRLGLIQQHYIRDFNNLTLTGQIKVFLFYKYLKNCFKNGTTLIEEFIHAMGVTSFFDYPLMSMSIVSNCISGFEKDGKAKWSVALNESQRKMIEHFSYRPHHFKDGKNVSNVHRDIMTHPFYFVLNEHPVVLDFNFLAYMAEYSLTYNFYSFTSLKNSEEYKSFKDFKGMLGKSYYEEFIMEQLLKNIFSAKGYKIFDDTLKNSVDFTVVFYEKEIYLFEIKSADISLNTLENNDANEFESFLIEQYAIKSAKHGRRKGVYQLLKSIENIALTNKLDSIVNNPSKKSSYSIYPIIVYTENVLDIPGVNGYLNQIFQKESLIYKNRFKKIYPLTTINITNFIEMYSRLKEDPLLLTIWIKSYWERCNSNKKSFEKRKHPLQFLRAGNPFGNYLRETLERQDPLINFRSLVEDLELDKE